MLWHHYLLFQKTFHEYDVYEEDTRLQGKVVRWDMKKRQGFIRALGFERDHFFNHTDIYNRLTPKKSE